MRARGEQIDPLDFEGLRSVATATLAGFDLGKPLVCAINGHCRAVGLDMMLASEMRVSVAHATFALEEANQALRELKRGKVRGTKVLKLD